MALLEVKHMDKSFGGHPALRDVSFRVAKGEVHALVGENGAGKSTLIKIVTGVYTPTKGRILWNGQEVAIENPRDARRLGINVIHQDRSLIPYFTGLENLYLGLQYPTRRWRLGINWRSMRRRANDLLRTWGLDIPLDALVQEMTPPQRTMLEILRAMMLEGRLLFLDEPTASLTDKESEILFQLIGRLKAQGTSIIYVSHRLEEIFRLADQVTVLRNGEVAKTLSREEANRDTLIHLMTAGQGVEAHGKAYADASSEPVLLKVKDVSTADGRVKHANLHVHRKEIVGIFGLAGAGRTELLEVIYGTRTRHTGQVTIKGTPIENASPRDSLKRGVVLIPEDRHGHGLIMDLSIVENMTLPVLSAYARRGVIQRKREQSTVREQMDALNVKANHPHQDVGQLSGGNQQKVVFAKALMSNPQLFLCDEPTQAVDIMTRHEIHRLLRQQAEQGKGVIFVSSDLEEVLEISDRIIVMSEGKTIADLANKQLDYERVLQLCYRHQKEGVI